MNDLKILAIGAFSVPYIKDNWFNSIKHLYPDTAICFNASLFIAGYGKKVTHEAIFNLLLKEEFDVVFFYFDWIYADFKENFFNVLKHAKIPTVVFYPDDEPEGWYNRNLKYDHLYDVIATHSKLGLQRRINNKQADKVLYVPWGYNQRTFTNKNIKEKKYDIVFIGKNKVHKNEPKLHREDGKSREDALLLLAKESKRNNWNFVLFGFGWENHPLLKEYASGQVDNDKMVLVYNQSKIVFNPAWSNDEVPKAQCKLRHFEVPGAGAFQITNYNEELSHLFENNKEICFYKNNNELIQYIDYYLKHDSEREKIADAGYQRAINEHTLDHRAKKLFTHMQLKYAITPLSNNEKKSLNIHQIRIKTISDIAAIIKQLKIKKNELNSFDALHFLAGDFFVENIEYVQLSSFIRNDKFNLLGIRSFVAYSEAVEDWIQPSTEEVNGDFLNETLQWKNISDNRNIIKKTFISLEYKNNIFLLCNFIVKPAYAIQLLEAFDSGSFNQVHALNPFNTACLINHFIVKKNIITDSNQFELEYMRCLKPVLNNCILQNQRIVIYGALGLMAERVLEYIFDYLPNNLVGIIDNGMAGKTIQGHKILLHQKIFSLKPDLVIIAASISGPQIYESLKLEKTTMQLVPLYDLEHAIWKILLP